ncbi:MAG TPA: alpha-glucosidase [Turneriella sp.]|nr:alpha-glucosidase [Turneriella sp.]
MADWYKEAIVYQIYPRSFRDSNGDGIGDLTGIREKIPYLKDLGVDTVWLSPINTSPMLDFGYDISDYRSIDPIFGTMADFDALLAELHENKIRLMMDLVVNHSSDQHPWFIESRSSRDNPKRAWYVWHDGKNGSPPNNWQSVFGGSAWEWDKATKSFYLHSFLKEQPDLNWRNPEVKAAVFAEIEFWLKKGIDGFRLDVVNLYFKDAAFRDNPLRLWGWRYPRPYEFQTHVYDMSQPEMHPLLKDLRVLLDKYNAASVGEVLVDFSGDPELAASYLGDNDELHLTFDFTLLYQKWDAAAMATTLSRWFRACGDNWPTLVFNNHDQDRSYTRYAKNHESDARAKVLAALLLTAKGTPFLYYGDEIGMKNGRIARNELRDPVGIRFWPLTVSRDVARTPMLWHGGQHAGFSTAKPWLPVNDDFRERNAAVQDADPHSILRWHRALLKLRSERAELRLGDWTEIAAGKDVLAYRRSYSGMASEIYMNFSAKPVPLPPVSGTVLLSNCGRTNAAGELMGYEVLVVEARN